MLKDKIETQKFCLLKQIDYLKKQKERMINKKKSYHTFFDHIIPFKLFYKINKSLLLIHKTIGKNLDITQYAESLFREMLKQQEVRYLQNLVYDDPFICHPYEQEHLARTKIFICEYVNRKCEEKGMPKAIKIAE